jgi:hypothetical protein
MHHWEYGAARVIAVFFSEEFVDISVALFSIQMRTAILVEKHLTHPTRVVSLSHCQGVIPNKISGQQFFRCFSGPFSSALKPEV